MKILSIEHALPARRITNDWVLEQVRIHNRETLSPSELELVEARLTRFLASAGTEVRYAVEKDERALDLCLNAGRAALATAGVGPNEIDFVLYVGVCRGWTEPAMANVVQAELGLGNATCFDIVDACASWLQALHVAHAYLRGGIYRRGLIVNCRMRLRALPPGLDARDGRRTRLSRRRLDGRRSRHGHRRERRHHRRRLLLHVQNFGEHYALCMFPLAMAPQFGTDAVDERHCTHAGSSHSPTSSWV